MPGWRAADPGLISEPRSGDTPASPSPALHPQHWHGLTAELVLCIPFLLSALKHDGLVLEVTCEIRVKMALIGVNRQVLSVATSNKRPADTRHCCITWMGTDQSGLAASLLAYDC